MGVLHSWEFFHEHGCKLDNAIVCITAARVRSLECLQYAHENGCPWNSRVYVEAIGSKSLDCLKYAFENGCPLHHSVMLGIGGKALSA